MKLFKDQKNNLYGFELDGSQDHLVTDDMTPITEQEADEIRADKQRAAFDALSYAEKRQAEYPPASDYLDGIVKGDQDQIARYIEACKAVKAKYPKA